MKSKLKQLTDQYRDSNPDPLVGITKCSKHNILFNTYYLAVGTRLHSCLTCQIEDYYENK